MPGHFARQSRSLRDFSQASISPFSGVGFGGLGVTDRGQKQQNFPVASHFPGCHRRGQRKDEEKYGRKRLETQIRPMDSPLPSGRGGFPLPKATTAPAAVSLWKRPSEFYIGYLACSHAQDYLAQVIPSTVKGIMDETANRMGRLMFKMAVEQAVTENILAAVCSVDQQDLTRLRGQCIEEIRKTNGLLSFDKALSWQRDD